MDIVKKLRETLISVVPVMAIVLILNFTVAPLGEALIPFLLGGVMLIAGLTIFLAGTDVGMVPIGERLGSVLAHKKNLPLVLVIGFLIGFGVTFAEPDVRVLAQAVCSVNSGINSTLLVFCIAAGLGVFIDLGLLRIINNWTLKFVFPICYGLVLVLAAFVEQDMLSISFDASGATTGPLAVPFILALGLGVSAASKNGEDSGFGLTGIASVGPVIAVCLMALTARGNNSAFFETSAATSCGFSGIFKSVLVNTATGFAPLLVIVLLLDLFILKFPKVRFRRILMGILYSFAGIVIFLTGVEYGFSDVGRLVGRSLSENGGCFSSVAVGFVLGAFVVCAEPAVWVLTKQVEEVTAGRLKKTWVMVFLCVGVASAVALALLRTYFNISFKYFVYTEVVVALVLAFVTPPLFTGLAFDSGGVASGPMSTTFLLSYAMGASKSFDTAFGLVGLIALSPLITIQILGVIYGIKSRKKKGSEV